MTEDVTKKSLEEIQVEVSKKILVEIARSSVERVLNGIYREATNLVRGLSLSHRRVAVLLVLDLIEIGAKEFVAKMRERVSRDDWGGGGH